MFLWYWHYWYVVCISVSCILILVLLQHILRAAPKKTDACRQNVITLGWISAVNL
jgi:hypothetical protein